MPCREMNDGSRFSVQTTPEWPAFARSLFRKPALCSQRVILISDAGKLSHTDIAQMQLLRERHDWFMPAIYFDMPDLGKVIHALDSNLAAYAGPGDTRQELIRLIHALHDGRCFYSNGFCDLLHRYGFPIDKTHLPYK